jgi:cell wall-associated NlpC family hydrolase
MRYIYNRLRAVQYAENWWNNYNPAFHKFEVDCTNFISQCLHAGGIPMKHTGQRNSGWWYSGDNWSYSWTVANALHLYLEQGGYIKTEPKRTPQELTAGDIICYDFDGDGHWQHSTIVVAKDKDRMPLVNAHTTNSQYRYWNYTDSTAYTPDIQYKFFHIL